MPTPDPRFHLFLSYARVDNVAPVNDAGEGWVSAFVAELKRRHAAYSGRELNIFFDQKSIDEGVDWKRRLGQGIRESRLFLAFLSPNYLISDNCLWEWQEYLRREHSSARGDDGLTPVYFVTPADLRLSDNQTMVEWLQSMQQKYPWFSPRVAQPKAETERLARPFAKDLSRRNKSPNLELQPWFEHGPQILRELDAGARSLEAKNTPRDPAADLRSLAEKLAGLDRHIARRLDRIALADLAPGNLPRGHEHFVGRHRELSELHDIMLSGGPNSGGKGTGGRGMIAAAFSPGGLGKTALARQYAHAYAEFYAAGGLWEIGCEDQTELGAALLKLADSARFRQACELGFDVATQQQRYLTQALQLSEAARADNAIAAEAVLDYLQRVTHARVDLLRDQLRQLPERHCPAHESPELQQPRALLILDNVDHPELLAANQRALIPNEAWLEIIVTTRLDPDRFGSARDFKSVEVGVLPEEDALQLLADFQPSHRFANADEEAAAREIAKALGGYTLAVELVAAYLGDRAHEGYLPSRYLPRLAAEGLIAPVDSLAGERSVQAQIRHSQDIAQNHIGTLINWSLARLSPPARIAMEFASLLMPDEIPLEWLRELTRQRDQEALLDPPEESSRWSAVWRELRGLRLLNPAHDAVKDDRDIEQLPQTVRIHRLVAEHVRADGLSAHRMEIDQYLDALTTQFEQRVGQGDDHALRRQHPWLRDQLSHLLATFAPTQSLLSSAGVAASYEGEHGSLSRALSFESRNLKAKEQLLRANPDSAQGSRDVSVSLERIADFLVSRGQAGDAELALSHYQRSLEVSEALLLANPDSAQGSRDVSVSLNKLADFLASRGQAGDAELAFTYYERDFAISEALLRANPDSALAARDVSVSLNKLADFLARRGQAGDAELALSHYQRSLEVREALLRANPDSAQGSRDVLVSLERLSAAESRRPGGAEAALELQSRSLQIALQLREQNPGSWFYQRSAVVAFYLTFQRARATGKDELAQQYLGGCYAILDPLLQAGVEVDQPMRQLHAQLAPLFKQPGEPE